MQRIERMKRISVLIGLFLIQMACSTIMEPRPTTPATPPIPTTAPPIHATEDIPIEQKPLTKTGLACVGTFGRGVTCIENNEWVNYTRENSSLGSNLIEDIAVCPDGSLLILHMSGVSRFDGTTWLEYGQGWGLGSAEAITCDGKSGFWVAHFRGASHYDGNTWTTYAAQEVLSTGPDATDLVRDIAIEPDGAVWIITASSIAVLGNDVWTVYQEGNGFDRRRYFEKIAFDSKGTPWVTESDGLLNFDGLFWNFHANRDLTLTQSIVVDARERVWIGTYNKGFLVFENGAWQSYTRENSDLASQRMHTLAVDERGRVWIGTVWGLHVIEGNTWTTYQMSNSGLADNDIYAIGIVGGGPDLPTAQKMAMGALSGKIIAADGAPLPEAGVEICVEPIYNIPEDKTPCEGQPYMRSATTGADGVFTIDKLPPGFYVIAIHAGETWQLYNSTPRLAAERVHVQAGESTDLGEIIVGQE